MAATFGSFKSLWSYLLVETDRQGVKQRLDAERAERDAASVAAATATATAAAVGSLVGNESGSGLDGGEGGGGEGGGGGGESVSGTTEGTKKKKRKSKKASAVEAGVAEGGGSGGEVVTMEGGGVMEKEGENEEKKEEKKEKKEEPICARLLDIRGLGGKAVAALLEFASDPANQRVVEGLMGELTIVDSKVVPVGVGVGVGVGKKKKSKSTKKIGKGKEGGEEGGKGEGGVEGEVDGGTGANAGAEKVAEGGAGAEGGAEAGPLSGETVVFTGRLTGTTRSEAEDVVRLLGGRVKKSITSEVTILVADGGEPDRESAKMKAARAKGVKVWDDATWTEFLSHSLPSVPPEKVGRD